MKFPLKWLKDYIDISASPSDIAKTLTQLGIEVDSVEPSALSFDKVIVAEVRATQKHPSADKLQIATVFDGTTEHQVVCGAANCRPGIKVAFATLGATLKDDAGKSFTIKKTKIRDVESFGMLCAFDELQLGHGEGIIEFPESAVVGTNVADMYGDNVFEVSLTPNLGHCLSLIGIARELSAATTMPWSISKAVVKEGAEPITAAAKVSVQDPEGCPRYACRVIKNIKIGPSPEWMQKRLVASGLRPINNVVDATNYVLLELGHPLHAFDYDKLEGHAIVVRSAKDGETFVTLDGKERLLVAGDVLICDNARPVALGGIMGGQNSEVSDTTRNILIESAYFKAGAVRRTSKRLGLQTDASRRFERFADPEGVLEALNRVTALINEMAGGEVCLGVIDVQAHEFPVKKVDCRLKRINLLLGTHLGVSEVETIFYRLGFQFHWDGLDTFTVTVPSYRADITIEEDLIEEVARIYGYDNIPVQSPLYRASNLSNAPLFDFERVVRTHMLAEGLQEFLTCDLVGPALLDIVKDNTMPPETIVKVLNPTSVEQSIMRTSLLPGLLQVVKYNVDHQNPDIHGFEVGRIHFKEDEQFIEQSVLGIVLAGNTAPHNWDQTPRAADFYDLKGIIENLLKGLRIDKVEFKQNNLDTFHSGRQASIFIGSLEIGSVGEVHPAIQRRLDVPQRIYFAELNLPDLLKLCPPAAKMEALPLYPASERDWTITLKEETPIEQVLSILRQTNSRLLESVDLVGIYRSEKLGSDIKNATFHFVYRDKKKTIAQETVDGEHARIIEQAKKKIENL